MLGISIIEVIHQLQVHNIMYFQLKCTYIGGFRNLYIIISKIANSNPRLKIQLLYTWPVIGMHGMDKLCHAMLMKLP